MFRKKYVRSEWMEGLLKAEHWLRHHQYNAKEHLFLEDEDGMRGYHVLWRNNTREQPWCFASMNREQGQGVLDYLDFIGKVHNEVYSKDQ